MSWLFGDSSTDCTKIMLHGQLTVKNFKAQPVRIIITRRVLGVVSNASDGGQATVHNAVEDVSVAEEGYAWWRWSIWPSWWYYLNPVSEIVWDKTIPAGETATVEYDWHYFYRG